MSISSKSDIDLSNGQLVNARLENNASATPTSRSTGSIIFYTGASTNNVRYYNGTSWVTIPDITNTVLLQSSTPSAQTGFVALTSGDVTIPTLQVTGTSNAAALTATSTAGNYAAYFVGSSGTALRVDVSAGNAIEANGITNGVVASGTSFGIRGTGSTGVTARSNANTNANVYALVADTLNTGNNGINASGKTAINATTSESSGIGVNVTATSPATQAITATANASNAVVITATTSGTSGTGVSSTASGGSGIAVSASATGSSGIGVNASTNNTSGIALQAANTGGSGFGAKITTNASSSTGLLITSQGTSSIALDVSYGGGATTNTTPQVRLSQSGSGQTGPAIQVRNSAGSTIYEKYHVGYDVTSNITVPLSTSSIPDGAVQYVPQWLSYWRYSSSFGAWQQMNEPRVLNTNEITSPPNGMIISHGRHSGRRFIYSTTYTLWYSVPDRVPLPFAVNTNVGSDGLLSAAGSNIVFLGDSAWPYAGGASETMAVIYINRLFLRFYTASAQTGVDYWTANIISQNVGTATLTRSSKNLFSEVSTNTGLVVSTFNMLASNAIWQFSGIQVQLVKSGSAPNIYLKGAVMESCLMLGLYESCVRSDTADLTGAYTTSGFPYFFSFSGGVASTWGITTNQLYSVTNTNNNMCGFLVGYKNHKTTLSIKGTHGATNYSILALVTRLYSNSDNELQTYIQNGTLVLNKRSSGVTTLLASAAVSISDNVYYTLAANCQDNVIKVYVNGTLYITYTLTGGDSTTWNKDIPLTEHPGLSPTAVAVRLLKGGSPANDARCNSFKVNEIDL